MFSSLFLWVYSLQAYLKLLIKNLLCSRQHSSVGKNNRLIHQLNSTLSPPLHFFCWPHSIHFHVCLKAANWIWCHSGEFCFSGLSLLNLFFFFSPITQVRGKSTTIPESQSDGGCAVNGHAGQDTGEPGLPSTWEETGLHAGTSDVTYLVFGFCFQICSGMTGLLSRVQVSGPGDKQGELLDTKSN